MPLIVLIYHIKYDPGSESKLFEFFLIPLALLPLDILIPPLLPLQILQIERVIIAWRRRGTNPTPNIGTESAVLFFILLPTPLRLIFKLHLLILQHYSLD